MSPGAWDCAAVPMGLAMARLERQHPGYEVRLLPSGAICATGKSLAARPWCVAGTLGEVRAVLQERC